jgi:hypothetical protein
MNQIDEGFEESVRVLSRAVAYLAMRESDLSPDAGVLEKARFLMRFGLSRAEAATIIGSSDKSVAVLERQTRKGSVKRNGKAKK